MKNEQYILKKENKTATFSFISKDFWNYKKEFSFTIIENFDINNDKVHEILAELNELGYKVIKTPEPTFIINKTTGSKSYSLFGKCHREDGPAFINAAGTELWYLNGLKHRANGMPAVEFKDGRKEWWFNGMIHREDGPAIESANGEKFWFINDIELTKEEFNNRINSYAIKI